jgi:hypothetical protein
MSLSLEGHLCGRVLVGNLIPWQLGRLAVSIPLGPSGGDAGKGRSSTWCRSTQRNAPRSRINEQDVTALTSGELVSLVVGQVLHVSVEVLAE